MNGWRLALLLFVYVSLDFADPLMPGAVHFVDGSLLVVDAERPRTRNPLAQPIAHRAPAALLPRRGPVVVPRPDRTQAAATVDRGHRGFVPPRRATRSSSDMTPSPEDH